MWIMTTVKRSLGETLTKGDKVNFLNTTGVVQSVVLYNEMAEIQLFLDVTNDLVKIEEYIGLEQLG